MAYQLTCPQSGVSVTVDCACNQVGHNPVAAGKHHDRCMMNNLTSNVKCPPGSGCCEQDHDHEAAAICPQDHDMACPEPGTCSLWASALAHHAAARAALEAHVADPDAPVPDEEHFAHALAEPPESCPGGHCHKDIPGCNVCHPIIITAGQGSAVLRPVTA
jgi:hypothetical protein